MKLIVGLGNPGKEYENTRHNVGFMILDNILGEVNWSKKFNGLYYKTSINGENVLFLKPQTYMNNSGECISKFVKYYKIQLEDLLVIHDDLDIDFKKIKIKFSSRSGGHNGIKSIINYLDSNDFARLKIGIKNKNINNIIDFVLSKFNKEEMEFLTTNYNFYNQIINSFIVNGIKYTKNHLNDFR